MPDVSAPGLWAQMPGQGNGTSTANSSVAAPAAAPSCQNLSTLTTSALDRPAPQLVLDLVKYLGGESPKESNSYLSKIAGTPLATDITDALTGTPNPANQPQTSPYGVDPLDLGQIFSKTLEPWLASQEKTDNSEISSLGSSLQSALSGASPQIQAAYAVAGPAQTQALLAQNSATNEGIASGTEMDALITALTNAANNAKLANLTYQEEPYVAATTGGTSNSVNPAVSTAIQKITSGMATGTPTP